MKLIKPGMFGKEVCADSLRFTFDYKNQQLLAQKEKIDYLFIGDSITERWDLYSYFSRSKRIINRGISGDVSDILYRRFEADAIQFNPGRIICLIGTNDMGAIDDDLWVPEDTSKPEQFVIDELYKNYSNISSMCKEKNIPLTICSILPSNFNPPFKCNERKELTLKLNEMLKTLCVNKGHDYVDYHSALKDEDGMTIRKEYAYDGVHPDADGYWQMSELLCCKYIDLRR